MTDPSRAGAIGRWPKEEAAPEGAACRLRGCWRQAFFAQALHQLGPRAPQPFVAVNCAGMPDGLLESELFGHLKGSFTGAYRDKPGKIEDAAGGSILLDEVGEMTLRMQGLLLRFLETGEIQKVGADHTPARVEVRVIASTNRDLQAEVAEMLGVGSAELLLLRTTQTTPAINARTTATPMSPKSSRLERSGGLGGGGRL